MVCFCNWILLLLTYIPLFQIARFLKRLICDTLLQNLCIDQGSIPSMIHVMINEALFSVQEPQLEYVVVDKQQPASEEQRELIIKSEFFLSGLGGDGIVALQLIGIAIHEIIIVLHLTGSIPIHLVDPVGQILEVIVDKALLAVDAGSLGKNGVFIHLSIFDSCLSGFEKHDLSLVVAAMLDLSAHEVEPCFHGDAVNIIVIML